MFKGLVMGRIIRVRTAGGVAPAIVTGVVDKGKGIINCQVFTTNQVVPLEGVPFSEVHAPDAWHWPPREE